MIHLAHKQTHGKKPSESTNATRQTRAFHKRLFHGRFLSRHYSPHFLYHIRFVAFLFLPLSAELQVMGWWTSSSNHGGGNRFIPFQKRPDPPWGSPTLLFKGQHGLFPRSYGGESVNLTAHLHLLSRLRMSGDTPSLSQQDFLACNKDSSTFIFGRW